VDWCDQTKASLENRTVRIGSNIKRSAYNKYSLHSWGVIKGRSTAKKEFKERSMVEDISILTIKKREEKEKRVSFMLATLNRADYLDKLLMNVREFLTTEDELIVMDGGSIDHTHEIIKKYEDIITIFESERDFGTAHALNKAILKSKGRILVNLNDDDYFYPDGIKNAVTVMEENPDLDALVCGGEYFFQGPVNGEMRLGGYQYLPSSETLVLDVKNIFNHVKAGFLFLRRRVISRVGLFDSRMQASDTEYMSRLIFHKTNFKYLNVKMFSVCIHSDSTSKVNYQQAQRDLILIAMRHGEWDEIMKHSLAEIGAALKLNDYSLGNWMLDIFWFKYHLSRHKKINIMFLKSYLFGIHLLHIIMRQLNNIFIHSKIKQVFHKTKMPVEPHWDGSLR